MVKGDITGTNTKANKKDTERNNTQLRSRNTAKSLFWRTIEALVHDLFQVRLRESRGSNVKIQVPRMSFPVPEGGDELDAHPGKGLETMATDTQ